MLIKKKTFAIVLSAIFIFSNTKVFSQEVLEKPTELFSLRPLFFIFNLLDNIIGVGCSYERLLSHHFSLVADAMAGFERIKEDRDIMYCISAGTSAGANFYPFGQDLDKLYLGLSAGIDCQWYAGDPPMSERYDVTFSLTPKIGWKSYWYKRRLMIDLYGGYKFLVVNTNHYYDNEDHLLQNGLLLGFGFRWRKRK